MQEGIRPYVKYFAVVVLLWLSGVGTARAIFIRGSADPAFDGGGVFNGDVWTAVVEFQNASASCVSGVTNFNDPTPPGHVCAPDAGTLKVTGTLSDGTNTAVLNFLTGPAPSISITTHNGIATAIQTGIVGPTAEFTLGSLQGFAWVDFEFGSTFGSEELSAAKLILQSCASAGDVDEGEDGGDRDDTCTPSLTNASTSSIDSVTVSQIPEPGTLWLALGALSMGWFVRRRAQLR